MPIEYLPGLKPGDKIDLSQFDNKKKSESRPEYYLYPIQEALRELAQRSEYRGLVNDAGQIIMSGPEAEFDNQNIKLNEEAWAKEEGQTWEEWTIRKESDPASLAEKGITLLFDRILRGKFAVLRASDYDDYENGADNIIIDRETGAVICGIDDVFGDESDDGGKRKAGKVDKIKRKMAKGGARIKYGATIKNDQLVPQELENVPLFYFSLSKKELSDLLHSISEYNKPTEIENQIYQKLVGSLSEQYGHFAADKSLDKRLRANLNDFAPSLAKMKAEIEEA